MAAPRPKTLCRLAHRPMLRNLGRWQMPRTRHFRYCIHLPLAAFAFLLCTSACGIEVNGVTLPEQIKSGQHGTALVLNGAGMRTKLGFKVYVAALYLPKKNKLAAQILHSNQP